MPIYEMIRNYVFEIPPASEKARHSRPSSKKPKPQTDDDKALSQSFFLRAAAGGIISGAVAQFICSPTDLLKVISCKMP